MIIGVHGFGIRSDFFKGDFFNGQLQHFVGYYSEPRATCSYNDLKLS